MLEPLLVPPDHKEHVDLECQIDEESANERRIKAGKAGSAEATGERSSRASVARFGRCGPELTPVGAFPLNVVFPTLQLNNHNDSSDGTYNYHEWPQELDGARPDVGPVGESKDGDEREKAHSEADAAVNLPFGIDKKQERAPLEQDYTTDNAVQHDQKGPNHGTDAQGEKEETVVTPHRNGLFGRGRIVQEGREALDTLKHKGM